MKSRSPQYRETAFEAAVIIAGRYASCAAVRATSDNAACASGSVMRSVGSLKAQSPRNPNQSSEAMVIVPPPPVEVPLPRAVARPAAAPADFAIEAPTPAAVATPVAEPIPLPAAR